MICVVISQVTNKFGREKGGQLSHVIPLNFSFHPQQNDQSSRESD